jgi:TonB family protein
MFLLGLSSAPGQTDHGTPAVAPPHYEEGGVTAQGERVSGQFKDNEAPWEKDVIKTYKPEYPSIAAWHRLHGAGLFRIVINVPTGRPKQVTVVHSTGVRMLDMSAISALSAWRFKRNTWRSVDVAISFEFGHPHRDGSHPGPVNIPLTHGGGMRP